MTDIFFEAKHLQQNGSHYVKEHFEHGEKNDFESLYPFV